MEEMFKLPPLHFVLSCPRVGFTLNASCIITACAGLGSVTYGQGAFWSQVLTRIMEDAVEAGAEYIVTIDYDTVFDRRHVLELVTLAVKHPEYAAIFPIQSKRASEDFLARVLGDNGERITSMTLADFLSQDVRNCENGHFGLTVIRVADLVNIAKPWFYETPDSNGSWRDGRVDADIQFWMNLRKAGLLCGMATKVRVGHLQQVITWPDATMAPVHQYTDEWSDTHKPPVGVPDTQYSVTLSEVAP